MTEEKMSTETFKKKEIKCSYCGFYLRFYEGFIGDIICPMCKKRNLVLDGLAKTKLRGEQE